MAHHPIGLYRQLFPQRHIPVILRLIFEVGKGVCKKTATDLEDRITLKLHRRLIREPIFRDGPLQIDLQPSVVNSKADVDEDTLEGRLDLKVSCNLGYETYFAIEAKRLRVSLPSRFFLGGMEYVKEGMMRFVTGQYAPFMQSGAMLGYVYDGDKDRARKDIDRHVQKSAQALKLKNQKGFTPSPILIDYPLDETEHNLEKRHLTIYHLLLSV